MLEYDARNEMGWDDFIEKIKIFSKNYGFDLKGQSLSDLLVFIFMRKMLDPDFMVLTSNKSLRFKTYRIYLLTLIRAFEIMGKMKNPPVKAVLKLITVMLELFVRLSLTKKNFSNSKKISERRFELLKAQLASGMSDKQIKRKISEVIKLKDPKSQAKYLQKWREWEMQNFKNTITE